MKLSKEKIKKRKAMFFFLCFGVLVSFIFIGKIFDLTTETTKINATVTKTYRTRVSRKGHHVRRPKMNIKWEDAKGKVHTEGSLYNKTDLKVGDAYPIKVDAKTHSRIVPSKSGSIVMCLLGCCFLAMCGFWAKCFFVEDSY